MKITIRISLVSILIALILITSGLVLSVSYFGSKRSVHSLVDAMLKKIANHTIDNSLHYLNTATIGSRLSESLSRSNIITAGNRDLLIRYFRDQLEVNKQFIMLNFGDRQGNFFMVKRMPDRSYSIKTIMRRGDKASTVWKHKNPKYRSQYRDIVESSANAYDPRTRPWYKKAVAKKGVAWTDAYLFFSDQKPGISCAAPVFQDGVLQGVLEYRKGQAGTGRREKKRGQNRMGFQPLLGG